MSRRFQPVDPGSERSRLDKRLLTILLALTFAWVGPTAAGPQPEAGDLFDRHDIPIQSSPHQTVLTGFLLGGELADVAVVSVGADGSPSLSLYSFQDGIWELATETPLGTQVSFVDVASIGGRDRLLTYLDGQLSALDLNSGTLRPLAVISSSGTRHATAAGLRYSGAEPTGPVDAGEIPHIDLTRDLNGDGLDDLVVPGTEGFGIFIQGEDGSFGDPVVLGPPEPFRGARAFDDKRTYGEVGVTALTVPWYLSRVHEMDYDLDGDTDLAFWNEDRFDVYLQDSSGLSADSSVPLRTEAPFDSDGAYSLLFGFGDAGTFSLLTGFKKSTRQTVLHAIRDVNGDDVPDLVTRSLEGRSVLKQRTGYAVHFGGTTPEGLNFPRAVSTRARPKSKTVLGYSSQWLDDFDGDGRVDVLFMDIKTGLRGMLRALLGHGVRLQYGFYHLGDEGFPEEPTASHLLKVSLDLDGGRDAGFFPPSLVGDVNGDGAADLLIGASKKELQVFLGGPRLLQEPPRSVAVGLPGDERNTWLVDLNRDGKQDVLMHRPSSSEPHRVTLLIAR